MPGSEDPTLKLARIDATTGLTDGTKTTEIRPLHIAKSDFKFSDGDTVHVDRGALIRATSDAPLSLHVIEGHRTRPGQAREDLHDRPFDLPETIVVEDGRLVVPGSPLSLPEGQTREPHPSKLALRVAGIRHRDLA